MQLPFNRIVEKKYCDAKAMMFILMSVVKLKN